MLPSPMLILAVVLAFVVNGFYWNAHGSNAADTRWKAKIEQQRADAEAKAREQEKTWQEAANAIVKNQDAKLAATRRNLDAALNGLRDRPERPSTDTKPPGIECPCSTGAGLCKQDAEFLARESSRADDIRSGLEACYEFADKVK